MSANLYFLIVHKKEELFYNYRYFFKPGSGSGQFGKIETEADALAAGFTLVENRQNDIKKGIIAKMNAVQDTLVDGKSIPEWLAFENISLWQFIPSEIFAGVMQETIEAIEYLSLILETQKTESIHVMGVYADHQKIAIEQTAKKHNALCSFEAKAVHPKKSSGIIGSIKARLSRLRNMVAPKQSPDEGEIIESGNRMAIGNYARQLETKPAGGNSVLCLGFGRLWDKNRNNQFIDQYYNTFTPYVKVAGYEFVRIELPYYFYIKDGIKNYIEDIKTSNRGGFKNILFDEYLDQDAITTAKSFRSHYETIFEKLSTTGSFLNAFSWRGVSFFHPLKTFWHSLFTFFLIDEVITSLLAARKMLSSIRPKLVFSIYETGTYARATIIEAKRLKIKTIGLQHGIIFEEHEYYMHKNVYAGPLSEGNFMGFIACDKTFVYGESFKNILTQLGDYPPETITITGDWRLQNSNQSETYSNAKDLKKDLFKNDPGRKTALLLTSQSSDDIISLMIAHLRKQEYNILIKMHPAEVPETAEYYKKRFTDSGFEVKAIFTNLHESIILSDIVFAPLITTAVLDALYYGKKLYCYNTFDTGFTIPWKHLVYDMDNNTSFNDDFNAHRQEEIKRFLDNIGYNKERYQPIFERELKQLLEN